MQTTRLALEDKFFPMKKMTWINVFQTLQPDIWVGTDTVFLAADDVTHVAQHLDSLPDVINARAEHGPSKLLFRRQPMNCPEEILHALAELEAHPKACGPAVYSLVTGIIRKQAEVERFYWTRDAEPREDDGTDSDQARAALLARVEALDRLRDVPGAV